MWHYTVYIVFIIYTLYSPVKGEPGPPALAATSSKKTFYISGDNKFIDSVSLYELSSSLCIFFVLFFHNHYPSCVCRY